jgi:hypothetical protein
VLSDDKKQALSEVQNEIHRLQSEFIKNAQTHGGTVQITPGIMRRFFSLSTLVSHHSSLICRFCRQRPAFFAG